MRLFADRMKFLRSESLYTKIDLANAMGVSREKILAWENGSREPSLSELVRLAGLLDCDVAYLAGEQDFPKRVADMDDYLSQYVMSMLV